MSKRLAALGLFAAMASALILTPAYARDKHDKRDPSFQLWSHETPLVKSYPGDQAFEGGTVRMEGPDRGPYVERCYWTINNPFNAPLNPTQRCIRYTLENTQ